MKNVKYVNWSNERRQWKRVLAEKICIISDEVSITGTRRSCHDRILGSFFFLNDFEVSFVTEDNFKTFNPI